MECNFVFLLNLKDNNSVKVLAAYKNKDEATANLENCAIEYIKELQGQQQAKVCKPGDGKTPDQIFKDITFKEGMYIFPASDNKISLYEKITIVTSGTLWGKIQTLQMNKIGEFNITDFCFTNCFCTNEPSVKISKPVLTPPKPPKINNLHNMNNMIQELKEKLQAGNGQFKLKSQKGTDNTNDVKPTDQVKLNDKVNSIDIDENNEDDQVHYRTFDMTIIRNPLYANSKINKLNKQNQHNKDTITVNLPIFPALEEDYEPKVLRSQSLSELSTVSHPPIVRSNSDLPLGVIIQTTEITNSKNEEITTGIDNNLELDKANICQQ